MEKEKEKEKACESNLKGQSNSKDHVDDMAKSKHDPILSAAGPNFVKLIRK